VLPGNQIRDSPARAGALGKQPILTLLIQPLKASARACAQAIKRVLVGPIGFVQKQRAVPTMPSAMWASSFCGRCGFHASPRKP